MSSKPKRKTTSLAELTELRAEREKVKPETVDSVREQHMEQLREKYPDGLRARPRRRKKASHTVRDWTDFTG